MKGLFPSGLALLFGILLVAWSAAPFADQPSPADCAAEADRASRGVGSGIGRGAALGGVIGGVRRGVEKDNAYKNVYDACMRRR